MVSNIETLLLEVSEILKEHRQNRLKNGDDFNIFKITGIQSDEVKMCRMLAEIIDPMGTHNEGLFFIRSFAKKVLYLDIDEEELASGVQLRIKSEKSNAGRDFITLEIV